MDDEETKFLREKVRDQAEYIKILERTLTDLQTLVKASEVAHVNGVIREAAKEQGPVEGYCGAV